MDECSGKRAVGGLGVGRRGSGLAFRDKSKHENQSVQYCNRIGCSTRINSVRGSQNGTTDTVKYSSPSFYSASRKAMAGNSSKTYSGASDTRKTHQELQKLSSHKELVPAETISKQEEKNVSESIPSSVRIQTELEPKGAESGVLEHLSADTRKAVGSYSVTSNSRPRRKIYQQSESGSQDTLGPSTRRPIASRNTSHVAKPTSHGQGANAKRNDLRNLRCTSISDVHSSSSSSSDSSHSRTDVVKRSTDGESSARGKNMIGPSAGGSSGRQRNSLSSPSFALSERPSSQQASRRARNCPPSRDGVASVRTRRKHNGETTARLSEHGNGNSLSLPEHPNMIPQLPQTEMLISGTTLPSSSQQIPIELPSICQNSDGQPVNNNENIHSMETVHSEDGIARPFHGLSMDRDGFRHFNMAGVAEVLLALERIEQDEELTYEQLLILETNLFLGGLSFHDQHRDMRLDIDNMSYEELLALEEKMGTVSTALTEEALSNCLKRSFYSPAPSDVGNMGCGDDVKCSICQEQYVEGDEVGKLGCEHPFHVVCIQQWLRRKNWCPICKAPAAPS